MIAVCPLSSGTDNSTAEMCVTDDGSGRADLQARWEIKYALQHADIGGLRQLLAGNCRRIVYNEPISTVRSIYFDDWRLSACYENLSGLGHRRKLRLRWYDQRLPSCTFSFEIKWRKHRLTGKHRLLIRSDVPLAEMSYDRIVSQLAGVLPASHCAVLLARPEPTIVVEYKREHFASRDGSLRVTLDYDLAFYDQMGQRQPCLAFPVPAPELVLLEAKMAPGGAPGLKESLHPFLPRVMRFSKYVHGCLRLGLLVGTVPGTP